MKIFCASGGGMLGSWACGCIKRFVEVGKEYDGFFGTSVGAINAAALAQFKTLKEGQEFMENLWRTVQTKDIKKHWFPFSFLQSYWKGGLYNSAPLRNYIHKHLDVERLRASGKKLGVCAVNLDTKKSELFTEQSEFIIDAVIASSITPFFLDPIYIHGNLFIDGGLRQVVPIQEAIDAGATEIDVIMTDPLYKNEKKISRKLSDVGPTAIGIMAHEIANNDLTNAIGNNPGIKITVFRPEHELDGNTLEFSKETIDKHIAYGYEIAKKILG